jgi:hypothetical protein
VSNSNTTSISKEQWLEDIKPKPKYETTDPKIFHYSAPTNADKAAFEELTALWITVAATLDRLCPVSREKSLAITKLDECRFFANGAIVRRS